MISLLLLTAFVVAYSGPAFAEHRAKMRARRRGHLIPPARVVFLLPSDCRSRE